MRHCNLQIHRNSLTFFICFASFIDARNGAAKVRLGLGLLPALTYVVSLSLHVDSHRTSDDEHHISYPPPKKKLVHETKTKERDEIKPREEHFNSHPSEKVRTTQAFVSYTHGVENGSALPIYGPKFTAMQ